MGRGFAAGRGGFMGAPSNPYQRPAPRQDYLDAINAANKREMEDVIKVCFFTLGKFFGTTTGISK